MSEVEAPGVWATFHPFDGADPMRLRILEVVDQRDEDGGGNAYVIAILHEGGRQFPIPLDAGWWSDPDGALPAPLEREPR